MQKRLPDLQAISELKNQFKTQKSMGPKVVDTSDADYIMSILFLHFPEEYSCTFDAQTKMFKFALDITLKYSIVKTIIGWNMQPHFNSILYDEKFVALLLNFIIGKNNLQSNNLPKELLRFIRGIN